MFFYMFYRGVGGQCQSPDSKGCAAASPCPPPTGGHTSGPTTSSLPRNTAGTLSVSCRTLTGGGGRVCGIKWANKL